MSRIRILALALAAALAAVTVAVFAPGGSGTASAHPLGNFTINHYDRIEVSETGIQVYRVLDMAEIPAFRERQQIDANGDGTVDGGEAEAYAAAKADDLRGNLRLRVNGDGAALSDVSHQITFPAGQGGLSLLRLTAVYRAALPADWRTKPPEIEFEDSNYADRLGWREIVVRNGAGTALLDSSAPAADVSHELTSYPTDALSSPLDVRSATFSFEPGLGLVPPAAPDDAARATRNNPDSTLAHFSDLIAKDHLTPGVIALALLAAMGFGAIHALSPGHGKTVVAAYLVGIARDGSPRAPARPHRDGHAHVDRVRAGPGGAVPVRVHRAGAPVPMARRRVGRADRDDGPVAGDRAAAGERGRRTDLALARRAYSAPHGARPGDGERRGRCAHDARSPADGRLRRIVDVALGSHPRRPWPRAR